MYMLWFLTDNVDTQLVRINNCYDISNPYKWVLSVCLMTINLGAGWVEFDEK